jgi:polar amino acid transport system substrate-binding protein
MKHPRLLILLFIVGTLNFDIAISFTASAQSEKTKKIVITSDPWCPYACDTDSKFRNGYLIDIAKEILSEAGYNLVYKTNNWARALKETREGKIQGIAGVTDGDKEGLIFTTELGLSENCFVVMPEESWHYKDKNSLKEISMGAIVGYTYNDEIDSYILENKLKPKLVQLISGSNAIQANWQKLKAQRIRAYLEDRNVFEYYAKEHNLTGEYRFAGCYKSNSVYIGFSEKRPEAKQLREILNEGLVKLRISGRLARILQKYNVSNWKPN